MRNVVVTRLFSFFVIGIVLITVPFQAQVMDASIPPLQLHPENPHYFLFRGEGGGFDLERGALRGGVECGL